MECNLLEEDIQEVNADGNGFSFRIKPFEIKTYKIKFA
jgi:alpha-mannosidase